MLCREFDARMQKLLDERRAPDFDSLLLGHAQQCATCRSQLVTLTQLLDTLDEMEVPSLAPEFAQHVVASLPTQRSPSTPSFANGQLIPTWLAALAATLVLVAMPAAWLVAQRGRFVAQPSQIGTPTVGQSTEPTMPHPQTPNSQALASEEGWFVSSDSILQLYPAEVRKRHREQMTQIADDLRPIATPFNATLTAIRRSLPVGNSQQDNEPSAAIERPGISRSVS